MINDMTSARPLIDSDEKELAEALATERQKRAQACWQAVMQACEQHQCNLTATAQLTPDGRIVAYPSITVR